jgi:hypothetical protein
MGDARIVARRGAIVNPAKESAAPRGSQPKGGHERNGRHDQQAIPMDVMRMYANASETDLS